MMNKRFFYFLFWCGLALIFCPGQLLATEGTITNSNAYAWGENLGWLNFRAENGNIKIKDTSLSGYIWSSNYGWINLKPQDAGVFVDCNGNLTGHGWAASFGWIDFTGAIINVYGKFTGVAGVASFSAGRINFDCNNCNVNTDWRPPCIPTPTPGPQPTSVQSTSSTITPTVTPKEEERKRIKKNSTSNISDEMENIKDELKQPIVVETSNKSKSIYSTYLTIVIAILLLIVLIYLRLITKKKRRKTS